MSSSRRLSFTRTVWIIGRLALRRQLNRWQRIKGVRKKDPARARSATPSKTRGRPLLSAILLLGLGFNGFMMGNRGLVAISRAARNMVETRDQLSVSAYTDAELIKADQALQQIATLTDPAERQRYQDMWKRYVDDLFVSEVRRADYSDEEETSRVQQMRAVFEQKGAAGFYAGGRDAFNISNTTWPREGQARLLFLRSLGLIVLLWMPLMIFWSLGTNNKDLGQVEWSFEWFYTFPVTARALFTSKLFEYSFLNPLAWVLFLPFLVLVFVSAGHGWWSLPLGFMALTYLNLLAGALATITEVALRKFLGPGKLKNFQAVFTVMGTVCLLFFYASTLSKPLTDFLVGEAAALPSFAQWNPLSWPLFLGIPSALPWQLQLSTGAMLLLGVAAGSSALWGSERLTRGGLLRASGPYQSSRRSSKPGSRLSWLKGITAQECLLLARDRNLLVQVMVVPLLVPAYYLLVNTKMIKAVTGNFRNAAMMAFAVGAYAFLNSAMPLLNRESNTLWYLLTFPEELSTILRKKATVWATIGVIYGAAVLLLIARFSRHLHRGAWIDILLALYGILIYAFLAAGIGILSTDVLQPERSARFRTDMVYLYMILAAMYANVIYSPSVWTKLAQLVLCTLMVFALWQKVRDISPYLLDPVALPPRTISLADGMIAILAFFALQGLILAGLQSFSTLPLVEQTTVAYSVAGVLVGSVALIVFWRAGIPDLWLKMGFTSAKAQGSPTLGSNTWKALVTGTALGGVAGLMAFAYLHVLSLFPEWQRWKQDAELTSFLPQARISLWMIGLAVVAAPLFEEFLFRGLVFQGLRRSQGPLLAVLGSAALFALVHPPLAVIPVFGLGIAAAVSFQRSKLLLAPIITHAVYNACVILFNRI